MRVLDRTYVPTDKYGFSVDKIHDCVEHNKKVDELNRLLEKAVELVVDLCPALKASDVFERHIYWDTKATIQGVRIEISSTTTEFHSVQSRVEN